jgi:hypothetical protein
LWLRGKEGAKETADRVAEEGGKVVEDQFGCIGQLCVVLCRQHGPCERVLYGTTARRLVTQERETYENEVWVWRVRKSACPALCWSA